MFRNSFDHNPKISRRDLLRGAAAAALGAGLNDSSFATKIDSPHGDIEKGFRPEEIEKMFKEERILRSDYYRPDILSSGKRSPYIKSQIQKGIEVIKDVPVAVPKKTLNNIGVFQETIRLDLPVSQTIKDQLEMIVSDNYGKYSQLSHVRLVTDNGLIVETQTAAKEKDYKKAWVILPPGTLLVKVDNIGGDDVHWCIAACLNPIYRVDKRKCPPCEV